jgi:CheY-like chemotaxis protein
MQAHVLLAEQDEALRSRLTVALEAEGFRVAGAGSQDGAFVACEAASPDLIVLDTALPEGNAWGILKRLETLGPLPPVLLLSERGDDPRRAGPMRSHVAACLFKPVPSAALVGICRRVLDFHASRRRGHERRREDRTSVGVEVAVGTGGPATCAGRLRDLSAVGFQLEVPALLSGLDRVRVTARVDGAASPLSFVGRVYWRRTADDGFLVGGDITSFAPGAEAALHRLLSPTG